MKIAVVTDNGNTISKHFGRATHYLVFTVETGKILHRELLEKAGHRQFNSELHVDDPKKHAQGHGFGAASEHNHAQMLEPILDCAAVIAGGMGRGAYISIEQAGLRAVVTDLEDPERAVQAYLDGTIINHIERLH